MKKVYFYKHQYDVEAAGPFDSIEAAFDDIRTGDESPESFKFYEAVKGEYVPPSSPETVRFPS